MTFQIHKPPPRRIMSGKLDGQSFEADCRIALERAREEGHIETWDRMHNGMNMVPIKGRNVLVPYEKTRADFMFTFGGCRRGLIEAKSFAGGKSASAEHVEAINDKQKRKIRYHQIMSLVCEHEHGGIGLLIVQLNKWGVWSLDGLGLRRWLEADEGGNYGSISLKHFQDYGHQLGEPGQWELPAFLFQGRGA